MCKTLTITVHNKRKVILMSKVRIKCKWRNWIGTSRNIWAVPCCVECLTTSYPVGALFLEATTPTPVIGSMDISGKASESSRTSGIFVEFCKTKHHDRWSSWRMVWNRSRVGFAELLGQLNLLFSPVHIELLSWQPCCYAQASIKFCTYTTLCFMYYYYNG